MLTPNPTHLPLSELSIDRKANVRKSGHDEADPVFVASIRQKGIIEPLIVRPNGKGHTIINGGKRYAALKHLLAAGEIAPSHPVPVIVRADDDAAALDTSLTTAIVRVPLHPVDRFEAFALLERQGRAREDIAAAYGMERKDVDRALALGSLSDQVRAAWRADEITADVARLFTIAGDHADQDAIFSRLKKGKRLDNDWQVKAAIVGERNESGALVSFVGADAYRAAGGRLVEDLFGSNHRVLDPAIAKKLADAKLQEECEKLIAAGWSWALPESELPKGAPWPGVWSVKPGNASKADKARYGCVVSIGKFHDRAGKLEIELRQKPEQKKEADKLARPKERAKGGKAAAAAAEEPDAGISNLLAHRLSKQLTEAAAKAIAMEPELAFAVALAGLMNGYGVAVKLRNEGMGSDDSEEEVEFDRALKMVLQRTPKDRMKLFAGVVGSALDFRTHSAHEAPLADDIGDVAVVCNAIDPGNMNKWLRATFNAEDYFGSAAAKIGLAALAEMDVASKGGKKADIAALAVESARASGWLPPELRTKHYDGPGGKAAKPARKPTAKGKRKPK